MKRITLSSNRTEFLTKRILALFNDWMTPHSPNPDQRFTERNLRLIVLVAWVAFPLIALSDLHRGAPLASMEWLIVVFAVLALMVITLRLGRPIWASGVMWLGLLSLPFDPSAVYWSPGTIMLTLLFTLFSLLILPVNRRLVFPLLLNLGVYVLSMITHQGKSPFPPDNTFSEPLSAFIAVAMGHLCIIVLGLFIRRDQAERDRLALLVEQERSDVLRQFLTNASHDLKTPMTKLKLTAYLLRRTLPDGHQNRITDLEASLTHLEAALEGMFEMTRLDSTTDFQLRQIDLRPFITQIAEAFQPCAAEHQHTLRCDIDAGDLTVYADPDHLQRALANILENALTYTPEKGIIALRAHRERAQIILEISDTGPGIPPDELPHIFERFFRGDSARSTATGKSGLGLAISKRIVMLHHGRIEAESRPNVGSTFTIWLPAASSLL